MERRCPDCGCVKKYTRVGDFNRDTRLNRVCRSCANLKNERKKPDYTVDENECWLWLKSKINGGYGTKKGMLAHRFYYEKTFGQIPKGLQLDHLCRNRSCVNPKHLEAVTREVNQRRGLKSRLNEEQVKEIRRIGGSQKQRDTALQFGVSQRLIWNILNNLTWKNI